MQYPKFLAGQNDAQAIFLEGQKGVFRNFYASKPGFTGQTRALPFENIVEKEKLLVQAISPFPTMFSTLSKTELIIFVTFKLSSANAFNLVWSKILLTAYA